MPGASGCFELGSGIMGRMSSLSFFVRWLRLGEELCGLGGALAQLFK